MANDTTYLDFIEPSLSKTLQEARQCHTALLEACGRETSPYRTVARWAHAFRNGREDVHQKRGDRRPQSASDVHVNAKKEYRLLSEILNMSNQEGYMKFIVEFDIAREVVCTSDCSADSSLNSFQTLQVARMSLAPSLTAGLYGISLDDDNWNLGLHPHHLRLLDSDVGPLDEKKLPAEGCTERNGEREKSSGKMMIGLDDIMVYVDHMRRQRKTGKHERLEKAGFAVKDLQKTMNQ
ncbi:hypothetical protein ANN_26462 [Periplaneta americana]|uniref:Mos1 transposase HTH domain-containing protein n=1 Tax=Periplaneta americana TaxID=6978 RepID=A0ABQ8RYD6_PERAM|nr:hypothetical protein ANN_26462 [Periplaneta americana]